MVLDLSVASVSSFCIIIVLLVLFSFLDIRYRTIKNEYLLAGGIVGCVVILLTGHLVSDLILHLTALLMVTPLAFILFKIGSIGGADAKSLLVVALVSPGIELGFFGEPVLEMILGLGGEMIVMLMGGYLYWKWGRNGENSATPLLPFLLLGYLSIQVIALF